MLLKMNKNLAEIGALFDLEELAFLRFKKQWKYMRALASQDSLFETQANELFWTVKSGESILGYISELRSFIGNSPIIKNDEKYVREKLAWLYPMQTKPVGDSF